MLSTEPQRLGPGASPRATGVAAAAGGGGATAATLASPSALLRSDEMLQHLASLKDVAGLLPSDMAGSDSLRSFFEALNTGGGGGASPSSTSSAPAAVLSPQQLSDAIALLDRQLHAEVAAHHGELLQQLSSLKDTEGVLAVVRAGVDSLQASVQRVRAEIAEPYKQIKTKTRQLAALHDTMELLRNVIKALKLVRKLRELVPEGGVQGAELAKAAAVYCELETLRAEADLAGVDVVDAQVPWVLAAGEQVRKEAMKLLEAGMESLNQAEVGSVLQVYFNMGELRETVKLLVAKYKVQASRAIATGLDMKAISASISAGGVGGAGASGFMVGGGGIGGPGGASRSGTPQPGSGLRARDALWQRMAACVDSLHRTLLAAWHLQRVLAKKRDPISHVVFLDHVMQAGDATPVEMVWEAVHRALATQLNAAFTASSFVKETFVGGFPRLVRMLEGLLDRLARDTDVKGVPPACRPEDRLSMMAALEPFQGAYLGQSLARLSDAVNSMLPAGVARTALPGPEHGERLIERVREEVAAVRGDTRLTLLVLHGAAKVLQLLSERCEYQVVTGPDARQVSGPATAAQQRNAALCVLLQEVHVQGTQLLAAVDDDALADVDEEAAEEVLSPGLGAVHGVAMEAVQPLFKAMGDRIEALLLQMHNENWGDSSAASQSGGSSGPAGLAPRESPGEGCSDYMERTLRAISHFHSEFLSKLSLAPPSSASSSSSSSASSMLLPGSSGSAAFTPALPGVGATGGVEPICTSLTRRLASRVLLFFVRHAAMLRGPLSESGKLRLARDMGELEFAVGQHLFPPERLGPAYRALRAFRPLLFLDSSAILGSSILMDLPTSVVLHHIFSRAGESELASPWQRNRLSPAQYSLWLDGHSEEEAWRGVKAALEAYAADVRARGAKEFSPLYPIMLSLGQTLVEHPKQQQGQSQGQQGAQGGAGSRVGS